MENKLKDYGFLKYKEGISINLIERHFIARVISQHRNKYKIVTERGIMWAQVSGKYIYKHEEEGGYPVVGDYVSIIINDTNDFAVIEDLLPRKTLFYRKDNWNKNGIQVLVSNFDNILICTSLNEDFNISRIERFIIQALESKAKVSIILTKADLCNDINDAIVKCKERFPEIPVHVISVYENYGLEVLKKYFIEGNTVLLLGSSGVGKSSLVNKLSNREIMRVGETSENGEGKHTTVHREIIVLPSKTLLIDTPGLREIGIISARNSIDDIFDDVIEIERQCKFTDCSHKNEKGCAIREAISSGKLDSNRYSRYLGYKAENDLESNRGAYLFEKWQRNKEKAVQLRKVRNNKYKK